jgi:hypothetical protein
VYGVGAVASAGTGLDAEVGGGVWCMVYGVWCLVSGVWCMVYGAGADAEVYGVWCMVYGIWCMVYGVWCMVYGVWCLVYGVWCMVDGVWCLVSGVWCMVYGVWCLVSGVWCMVQVQMQRCMVYGVWCMVYGVWCMVYCVWDGLHTWFMLSRRFSNCSGSKHVSTFGKPSHMPLGTLQQDKCCHLQYVPASLSILPMRISPLSILQSSSGAPHFFAFPFCLQVERLDLASSTLYVICRIEYIGYIGFIGYIGYVGYIGYIGLQCPRLEYID